MVSTKEKLYRSVDALRKSFELDPYEPVDVIHLLSEYENIDVTTCDFKTPGLCGVAMVGDKVDTIALNANRTAIEQNFDCGHELIHLFMHRKIQDSFSCFTHAKPEQDSFREWQANEGSAQFIVPYQDFIPRFSASLDSYHTSGTIQSELAAYYFVSTQVINIRIESLSYEIDQYRSGVPIEKIELLSRRQRRVRGIESTNYSALCDFALDWDSVII